MKFILAAVAALAIAANAAAVTLSLGSAQLELAHGWMTSVEMLAPAGAEFGDLVSARHPDGVGVLKLQTYTAPEPVDEATLRLLTNVPEAEPLIMQRWGDYTGYRHDYVEDNFFYRIWWLAREERLVFITYRCDAGQQGVETNDIDQIVRSLSATVP